VPHDDLVEILTCRKSGHRANPHCPETDTVLVPQSVKKNPACPYHKLVHLTPDQRYRTNLDCQPDRQIVTKPWFVLPPQMAWYYNRHHGDYQHLPPFKPGCIGEETSPMAFIYPRPGSSMALPVDLDGEKQSLVFRVAHAHPDATLYWHLDDQYTTTTRGNHEIELSPPAGDHVITVVDQNGYRKSRRFVIMD
jgi:penicillin-binding protein 1C